MSDTCNIASSKFFSRLTNLRKTKMAAEMQSYKSHLLILPFTTQGHINPMLQFSKRLQHKGIKVTLVVTKFIQNGLKNMPSGKGLGSIAIDTISDGKEDGDDLDVDTYLAMLKQRGSQTLVELLEKYQNSDSPVSCIVYDSFMPWVLDVAKKFGISGAVFFTQSGAVSNIYSCVQQGKLKLPVAPGSTVSIPGLPILEPSDMPSAVYKHHHLYPNILQFLLDQFSNVDRADYLLFNTIYNLEEKEINQLRTLWPLLTVGPTVPSNYLDKQIEGDNDYGVNMFRPETSACIKWLNERSQGSVVFMSFGSIEKVSAEQTEELARGLRGSDKYFLWVVRESEQNKLPKDFVKETSDKGLLVSWCPQLEVLSHTAIGCFVSHCGWNSTLEAISLGVPIVAIPNSSDQSTNAKYVADVWENGVQVRADSNGIVRAEELERCIKEVMEGENGKKFRSNAIKWKQVALDAVVKGGTSDKCITEFVNEFAANKVSNNKLV